MPGLMTAERNVDATATASHGHRKWWRKVWSLNIPPKIGVFWWKHVGISYQARWNHVDVMLRENPFVQGMAIIQY